jgi:hypothetical protein
MMPSAIRYKWTIAKQTRQGEVVYAWAVTDPSGHARRLLSPPLGA